MDYYILDEPGSEPRRIMFNDLNNRDDVLCLKSAFTINNKLKLFLNKIHYNYRLNKKRELPFKDIWNKYHTIEGLSNIESGNRYFIIFNNFSLHRYTSRYLLDLKKKGYYLVLILLDPMVNIECIVRKSLKIFHQIYTFDKQDALQYNFAYVPAIYSRMEINTSNNFCSDVFFVGRAKQRINTLTNIFSLLRNNGINTNFHIIGMDKVTQENYPEINHNEMNYKKVLEYVLGTKCLLEVIDKSQTGTTLRALEAVTYGKKLITNNKEIVNMPFYDSKYIQVFERPEDIDIEFIKSNINVKYNYDDEYSPLSLLSIISSKQEE